MKKQIFFLICFICIVCNGSGQANFKKLSGKWKFFKIKLPSSAGFDLDDLTTSYKQFFYERKHIVYHDTITENDSLYIQVQFGKVVNDINKMFISFDGLHYETNDYDGEGNMAEKTEKGTYKFNAVKNEIYTYPNGNRSRLKVLKVIFLDEKKLVISPGKNAGSAVFTCKRVLE